MNVNFSSEKTTLILPEFLDGNHSASANETMARQNGPMTNGRNGPSTQSNHLRLPNESAQFLSMRLVPNSPMVKRSKYERDKCQKVAREDKTKPTQWAYCLLSNVYSLWFMYLPTMIECYTTPRDILNYAYKILVQMNRQHLTNPDEVRDH